MASSERHPLPSQLSGNPIYVSFLDTVLDHEESKHRLECSRRKGQRSGCPLGAGPSVALLAVAGMQLSGQLLTCLPNWKGRCQVVNPFQKNI